jgi:predicted small lipoprotein YifL
VNRIARCLAVLATATLLPLGLAACGVKGPLEAPPGAAVATVADGPAPVRSGVPDPALNLAGIPVGPSLRPATGPAIDEAPAARQRSTLDWLID